MGILFPRLRQCFHVMRNAFHPQKFRIFGKRLVMSKEDLKAEIVKVLDNFPDRALEDILSLLRRIDPSESAVTFSDSFIEKIMTEDASLLKRLAS